MFKTKQYCIIQKKCYASPLVKINLFINKRFYNVNELKLKNLKYLSKLNGQKNQRVT